MFSLSEYDYQKLSAFLQNSSGQVLPKGKELFVENRLIPLVQKYNFSQVSALVDFIELRPEHVVSKRVMEAMAIHESSFFRDRKTFDFLENTIIPTLLEKNGNHLNIWCAGCSSGQEPYSIAMVCDDLEKKIKSFSYTILATDLSESILDYAKEGRYTQFEVQRGLSIQRVLSCFYKDNDFWCVNPQLKRFITFKVLNLLHPWKAIGPFDIIFCRNVMIYFDDPLKNTIFAQIINILKKNGFLIVGASEIVNATILNPMCSSAPGVFSL